MEGVRRRGTGQSVSEATVEFANKSRGGRLATIISVFALLFSGYSFYETVLRQSDIRLFVPPVIKYSHPSQGNFEVFNIPITLANYGARSGTILSMDLAVTNIKTGKSKRYYSAAFGLWRQAFNSTPSSFAPLSVAGKDSYSKDLLFYTRFGEEIRRIIDQEGGSYRFELRPTTASGDDGGIFSWFKGASVQPVRFQMEIGSLDYRNFNKGGTMAMHNKEFKSTVGGGP